ncbi:ParB/RepB/Spo0J family partition protein [Clostridium sp. DJ247]|uniref:ParB/RepB/Spo0J family partition protein n=1 Tax=Clostridium sp. DJ247 TaxID=2726188 RepID=UPI001A9BF38B|nr:ParB/RepB/Spo0J family partition protein [Clostridium sp. DJ247]
MVDTQLGRRNLTPIQRIAIAEKYRPIFVKKAKENKSQNGGDNPQPLPKLTKPEDAINTRSELARIAGVSNDTYSKGKKILESDNEDVKQKVINGELKINTAYNELFGKKKEVTKVNHLNQQDSDKINTQGISNESFSQQEDIKENGLINPPVVTPDNVLIAGERRVRACEYAGYNQIEVRVMSVKDNEHQLKMEISENENRKEFTFSERIDWAKRLERIEKAKARERQKQSKNIVSEEKGEAAAITAKKSGFGSKETYRQAKYIYENASKELIGQLDEGRISINKAYTTLKQEKEELQQDFKEICGKFGIKI